MRPVATARTNTTIPGDGKGVPDLPLAVDAAGMVSTWLPDARDLAIIRAGGRFGVKLLIAGHQHPQVAVELVAMEESLIYVKNAVAVADLAQLRVKNGRR